MLPFTENFSKKLPLLLLLFTYLNWTFMPTISLTLTWPTSRASILTHLTIASLNSSYTSSKHWTCLADSPWNPLFLATVIYRLLWFAFHSLLWFAFHSLSFKWQILGRFSPEPLSTWLLYLHIQRYIQAVWNYLDFIFLFTDLLFPTLECKLWEYLLSFSAWLTEGRKEGRKEGRNWYTL